jgi:hypothetical protein
MSIITKKEKKELYTKIRTLLGYPLRKFELGDKELDTLLEIAIEDYSTYINNWLIEQQWHNLQGIDVNTTDLTFALITKTLDFEKSFTLSYSKQVGLGSNAPSEWELKRDFIVVSGDTQVYSIPAGREINDVLWFTQPDVDQGLVDPYSTTNWGAGAFGWSYLGRPAQYVQPTYSLLLNAMDRSTKRKILQAEMSYRITAGPNGTKYLYLYPVPGSRYEMRGRDGKHLDGAKVWYFYYDTSTSKRDKCLEQNDDIIKLPSDVSIDNLKWGQLNSISKNRVRRMLLAESKMTIGGIRGFFSGDIKAGNAELTMDYRHLLEEGQQEKEKLIEEIKESLDKISYQKLMEDRASIAQNLNTVLTYQPFKRPFMYK